MKTIIAICLLISSVSFADKQSDKDSTDRCFEILNSMVDETNSANFGGHGDDTAYRANVKFKSQKDSCFIEKKNFERLYGKYNPPKASNQNHFSNSTGNVKAIAKQICYELRVIPETEDKEQLEMEKRILNDSQKRYKSISHHDFNEHCETSEEQTERKLKEEDEKVARLNMSNQ